METEKKIPFLKNIKVVFKYRKQTWQQQLDIVDTERRKVFFIFLGLYSGPFISFLYSNFNLQIHNILIGC